MAALLAANRQAEAHSAAIVIDTRSGEVLAARNADKPRFPASLTKMMTLYMVFEALEAGKLKLDGKLPVSKRAAGQTPSRLGLKVGQTITVKEAVLALVTHSANDAATVLAEALGATEATFAQKMTARARALGMKRTRFTNASGLPNRRQRTTARDMATLARALQRDFPQYYHFFATRKFTYGRSTYRNHNQLLGRYAGADGMKTGYIRASGFNLAASARRGRHRLIGVVFGARSTRARDDHMTQLLDSSFAKLEARERQAKASTPPPRRVAALPKPRPRPTPSRRPTLPAGAAVEMPDALADTSPGPPAEPSWSIQVGAYQRLTSAKKRAADVVRAAPEVLANAGVWIARVTERGKNLYRARFMGFSESQARRTCRLLRWKKIACLPVSPRGRLILALARP